MEPRFSNRHYVMLLEDQLAALEAKDATAMDRAEKRRHNTALRGARVRLARTRGRHTAEQWQALVAETDGFCVRCGYQHNLKFEQPCKGFIIPLAQGGSLDIDNIQPLCLSCASSKKLEAIDWLAAWRHDRDEAGKLELPEGA